MPETLLASPRREQGEAAGLPFQEAVGLGVSSRPPSVMPGQLCLVLS